MTVIKSRGIDYTSHHTTVPLLLPFLTLLGLIPVGLVLRLAVES